MSLLRNLTGITTPASTDLFYVVQNNTDYKMTSEQFMNFAKSAIVVSLTQAQYDALTPAEKSNGSIYLINDATLSASDIAYGQGTVEDSLDEIISNLSDLVVMSYVTANGVSVPVGDSSHTLNVVKTGYKAVGVVLSAVYSTSRTAVTRSIFEQTNVLTYITTNSSTTAYTNATITFGILYVKTL